jgi:hypothetical protein
VKTIAFQTGRQYAANGQIIIATLHDDGIVTFMDHSRHIDGEFKLRQHCRFNAEEVLHCYDAGATMYHNSQRSWQDGMDREGCNCWTRPNAPMDIAAMLFTKPRMTEVVLPQIDPPAPAYLPKEGLIGLDAMALNEQLVLFAAHHGFEPVDGLAKMEELEGVIGSPVRAWLAAYSDAWGEVAKADMGERITIWFDTENDAFADEPMSEVARILRKLADIAEQDGLPGWLALQDSNGNSIGEVTVASIGE